MRPLLIAAYVIAIGMVVDSTIGLTQIEDVRASNLMLPDAMQTKAEVLRRIPINSPIEMAKRLMADDGFKCATMRNTSYADFANSSRKQVSRGPADILHCDSGERNSGLMFVTTRWQISFEITEGKVSYIAVGVGLTGP